jgi:hypothetical protein
MAFRYPNDIVRPECLFPNGRRSLGRPYEAGERTDAWGCTWRVDARGTEGRLIGHPLPDAPEWASYEPPWELLDGADFHRVNRSCAGTSEFVLAWSEARPFERLRTLCGTDKVLGDLESGGKSTRKLLMKLHEYCCREISIWASSDVDGVAFFDSWSGENGSLVTRKLWRNLLKPLYRDYCRILHKEDKFAFLRCSGNVTDVLRDLVQIEIDAVHFDLSPMSVQSLATRFRGEITFWGGIDRTRAMTEGNAERVREAVYQIRRALDYGSGGLIAQCTWEPEIPFHNVTAVFDSWLQPILAHA